MLQEIQFSSDLTFTISAALFLKIHLMFFFISTVCPHYNNKKNAQIFVMRHVVVFKLYGELDTTMHLSSDSSGQLSNSTCNGVSQNKFEFNFKRTKITLQKSLIAHVLEYILTHFKKTFMVSSINYQDKATSIHFDLDT